MNQKYCSNCGKLISSDSNFCTYCGAPQHGKEASAFRAQSDTVTDPKIIEQMASNAISQAQNQQTTNAAHLNINDHTSQDIVSNPYMPRQTLGTDAILFFILTYWSKTFLMFILILVGVFLLPSVFIFAMVAYLIGIVMTALLVHNNFHFQINEDGLIIERGILYKHTVSVPFEQVQNVNIERAIIDRILGFSRISIETAGAAVAGAIAGAVPKAEAYIPAIHLDKAKHIHDVLLDGADGTIDGIYKKH